MIRHLPHFVVVAEEGNFQRASRRLNIAQSALSRRMRDLEFELGNVPLFIRSATGLQLTPSGEAFLKEARAILARLDDARARAVAIMQGQEGFLRIGYSVGAVRSAFIAELFGAFREAFPRVILRAELLPVEDLQARLRRNDLDAAIFYVNAPGPEFESLLIAAERFVLAIPRDHRLAARERVSFADIVDEAFVWYSRVYSPTVAQRIHAAFEQRGAVPRISIESPTSDTALQLVAAGFGIGFVAPLAEGLLPPNVVLREVEDFALEWEFRLVWLAGNASPILPRLIAAASRAITAGSQPTPAA